MSETKGPVEFSHVKVTNGAEHGLWGRILDEVIVGRAESCVYDDETQEILPAILVLRKLKPAAPATVTLELPRDVVEWWASATETAAQAMVPPRRLLIAAAKRALAAEQPACADCGLAYEDERWFDLVVLPHEEWTKISPTGDAGGFLCPTCIAKRLTGGGWQFIATKVDLYCDADSSDCPAHGQPAAEPAAECACGPCRLHYRIGTCTVKRQRHDADDYGHDWQGDSSACPVHGEAARWAP